MMSSMLTQRNRQKMASKRDTFVETSPLNVLEYGHQKADTLIIPGGPFVTSSFILQFLYKLSCLGISPWCLALDYFLSRFVSTTANQQQSDIFIVITSKVLISFALVLIFAPFAVISFFIWLPLQLFRPRSFSYLSATSRNNSVTKSFKYEAASNFNQPIVHSLLTEPCTSKQLSFIFVSGNVCLMPEFTARINNLSHSVNRAEKIADYFCNKPVIQSRVNKQIKERKTSNLHNLSNSESIDYIDNGLSRSAGDNESIASTTVSISSKGNVVSDVFPDDVDFLCLQEVFDDRATQTLLNGLSEKFPYIIYDVAWPIHNYRMTLLGSGLCIASRFPFLDVRFHAFPHGSRDDKLACKGLLMTKVYLSKTIDGNSLVGYLSTTHLQAWSRTSASNARCKQLNLIENWMKSFKETANKVDEMPEIVVFDVITGDFNFDKISSYDHNEQTCTVIQNFSDPCVDETGALHSWVVGTELNQKKLHDDMVQTPQGLRRMLISELERHHYVESTMAKQSSLQRVGDGKRKIDYILYKQCESINMTVKGFNFFTGLTTLTDHIPIGMSINCELTAGRTTYF